MDHRLVYICFEEGISFCSFPGKDLLVPHLNNQSLCHARMVFPKDKAVYMQCGSDSCQAGVHKTGSRFLGFSPGSDPELCFELHIRVSVTPVRGSATAKAFQTCGLPGTVSRSPTVLRPGFGNSCAELVSLSEKLQLSKSSQAECLLTV